MSCIHLLPPPLYNKPVSPLQRTGFGNQHPSIAEAVERAKKILEANGEYNQGGLTIKADPSDSSVLMITDRRGAAQEDKTYGIFTKSGEEEVWRAPMNIPNSYHQTSGKTLTEATHIVSMLKSAFPRLQ